MANFDFMVFDDDSFVANAKTYTKEQVYPIFQAIADIENSKAP